MPRRRRTCSTTASAIVFTAIEALTHPRDRTLRHLDVSRLPPAAEPAQAGRGTLRRFSQAIRFYSVLCMFGLMSLAWSVPAALFFWVVPRRSRAAVGQFGIMSGFRIYLWLMRVSGVARFDISALDALVGERGLVIVSNHRSLLDAVLVVSRLPRAVCIAKAGLWDSSFLGGGIRMAGYIRNDSPLRLVRAATAALQGGEQHLLIFPEGTRSLDERLGRFRPGFAAIARNAGVAVQTVLLEGDSPYLCKGWGLFRRPELPATWRARLGRRFEVTGDTETFVRNLEAYFREELAAGAAGERTA